jgi:hypothetical protein
MIEQQWVGANPTLFIYVPPRVFWIKTYFNFIDISENALLIE